MTKSQVRLSLLGVLFWELAGSTTAQAIHLNITGNLSNSSLGLLSSRSQDLSGGVAIDLGTIFRIGVTHREEYTDRQMFEQAEVGYSVKRSKVRTTSNSLDLTVILYAGQLFVPYILGGAVWKRYEYTSLTNDEITDRGRVSTPALPHGGFGFGLRMSRDFSLKVQQTFSPGYQQEPNGEIRKVLDTDTQVGVSYQI